MLALLTYAAVAFALDQSSKRVVQTRLAGPLPCGRFLHLREVRHRERVYRHAAFRAALVVVWLLAVISAVWLHKAGLFRGALATAGVGCALGGAAGNLADIRRRQHVVDFIDLGWWPVFNLADVAIVGGLLLAFCDVIGHA
jgi:signal peptidase II